MPHIPWNWDPVDGLHLLDRLGLARELLLYTVVYVLLRFLELAEDCFCGCYELGPSLVGLIVLVLIGSPELLLLISSAGTVGASMPLL